MGESLMITLGVIGFTLTLLSPFLVHRLTKYKLEIERMRLDAEVKKEEIRVRNQFEMEKYMMAQQAKDTFVDSSRQTDPKPRADADFSAQTDPKPRMNDRFSEEADPLAEQPGRERLKY